MEPPEEGAPRRRACARFPLQVRVHLEFQEQRYLLSESATNLSPGGMFIRSESPRAPGDRFEFEARLTDKGPPLVGRGEVVWVRSSGDQGEPPGMGTRFLEVDETTRQLLSRLEEAYRSGGAEGLRRAVEAAAAEWERKVSEEDATLKVPAPVPALPETEVIHLPRGTALAGESPSDSAGSDAALSDAGPSDAGPSDAGPNDSADIDPTPRESAPHDVVSTDRTPTDPTASHGIPEAPAIEPSEDFEQTLLEPPVSSSPERIETTEGEAEGGHEDPPEGIAPPPSSDHRGGLRWGRLVVLIGIALLLLGTGLLLPELGFSDAWRSRAESAWGRLVALAGPEGPEAGVGQEAPGAAARLRSSPGGVSLPALGREPDRESGEGRSMEAPATTPAVPAATSPTGIIEPGQAPTELRAVEAIERRDGEGGLLLAIRLDGPLGQERVRHLRLEGPRRIVVILAGIAQGFAGPVPEVATTDISGVRLGFHQGEIGPEQHIVFDLAHPSVTVRRIRETEEGLEVLLARP